MSSLFARPVLAGMLLGVVCAAQAQEQTAPMQKSPIDAAREARKVRAGTLTPTAIKDLYYGETLFQYFQDDYFTALTHLRAAQEQKRVSHHADEAELLVGGLYLSYGQHLEAGRIFENLLARNVSPGVRDRAWFYLGKVWYQRGYADKAEQALRKVEGNLSPSLQAERALLLAQVLIQQNRYADAIAVLNSWVGPKDWNAYVQFNLGVALVREKQLPLAAAELESVGRIDTQSAELLALKDKANLALGYAWLQAGKPENAKPVLERVRLNGPQSNKALLAAGWAESAQDKYRDALTPWMELHGRNLLDAAVQESYLAVPYAFSKLGADAQAAEQYTAAIQSYGDESTRIDESIAAIRAGGMLKAIIEHENSAAAQTATQQNANKQNYGWFWQLEKLPDAPESRYLYHLLAGHEFQEGLKNYRDLRHMQRNLQHWLENLEAFNDMLATRRMAYDSRLPETDSVLARRGPEALARARVDLASRLNAAERNNDAVVLATTREQQMWADIKRIEAQLADAPADDTSADEMRDKLRLLKGVLSWRMEESFKARLWNARRSLKELDNALKDTDKRWLSVQQARIDAPREHAGFAERLAGLRPRIEALDRRLVAAADAQEHYLADIAVRELELQKGRLANYQLQARYALATIYDRSSAAEQKP